MHDTRKSGSFYFAAFLCLWSTSFTIASAQQTKQPFTLADEIGLTLFGPAQGGPPELHLSPDGNYFAVWSERGRLNLNIVEDSLRFYRRQDVEDFLKRSRVSQPPSPVWVANRSGKEGRIISDWHWLNDSSGVALLERRSYLGDKRLLVADLRKKTIEHLTSATEMVKTFEVCDRNHYVYTVADPADRERIESEHRTTAVVGTGRHIDELLFEADPNVLRWLWHRTYLWAVIDGKRFAVKSNGAPLVIPDWAPLALSPDGRTLVTQVEVPEAPESWGSLYEPSFASSPYRIRPGQPAHQYVRVNLQTGSIQTLTGAPISNDAGWWVYSNPSWSSDGQAILLPGTFLKSKDNKRSRPCVAVVDLSSDNRTCVETLKGRTETGVDFEEGYHPIADTRFVGGDKQRVMVIFTDKYLSLQGATEYRRATDGTWQIVSQNMGNPEVSELGFEVAVKQSFNEPPLLVAANKRASRIVWDPNPQLKNLDLPQATVYTWRTKEGQELKAGLFKPNNYKPGQRYPLVIQTHGFVESQFRPSGVFPTAFAAEALAATGIAVLQVQEDCPGAVPSEGPCAVSEYEAVVNQLVSEGLADPERIGIIGFSRTCFYVMEALTIGSLHLKAASITDGVMEDYVGYILLGGPGSGSEKEANVMMGAPPFREGLQQWLKRSPGFNLDKVTAPLLVVAGSPLSLLGMWQPYAGLQYLHKPVDLIMLHTLEHPYTNPAVRIASQGGSVDWFRFWLQDYEDPDPTKKEQYERWRGLKKMQEENDKKAAN